MRAQWIERRLKKSDGNNSQMHLARKGEITEEMHYVAAREELDAGIRARRNRARTHDYSRQHQSHQSRTDGDWRQLEM